MSWAMDARMAGPNFVCSRFFLAIHRQLSSFSSAMSTGYSCSKTVLRLNVNQLPFWSHYPDVAGPTRPSDQVAEHSAMALGWLKQLT